MAALNLDPDEGILITTTGVHRSVDGDSNYIDEMHLTNKNIIYVTSHSEKTGGMFSKSVTIENVQKVPLSEIKVINGQVLASQQKTDFFEYELQIQFVHGVERYSYSEGSKKITTQWVNELNRLLGSGQPVQEPAPQKKNEFLGGLSGLASSVGAMAGTFGQSVTSAAKQAADSVKEKTAEAQAAKQAEQAAYNQAFQIPSQNQQPQQQPGGAFCANCGTQLAPGTKFCPGCGTPVADVSGQTPPPIPQMQAPQSNTYGNSETRQQEFAGKVLKCPNCGAVISQTTAVCPECGMRITGQAAVSSVQTFQNQLMALESKRKKSMLGMFNVYAGVDPVDKQKVALIQNFPIPNTVDDILEFMFLAVSNIDVKLSKKSWGNSSSGMQVLAIEMPKVISDAWVGKMQQVYQKAEMLFPDDPSFAKIKQIYTDKMVELKMMKK